MTGTPSRTTTAYDGGETRHCVVQVRATPRGYVGRKLQAKLRSEEHKSHMRQPSGGRGRVVVLSPTVIRTKGCICGGYVERKSRALPWEVCLSALGFGRAKRPWASRKSCPGRPRDRAPGTERIARHTEIQIRAREAERSTMGKQKSAESRSCQRTTTKEEHMESNRNGAFDA